MKAMSAKRRGGVLFDQDHVITASVVKKSEAHVETVLRMGGTHSQELATLFADVIGLSYEETLDRYLQCGMIAAGRAVNDIYRALYRFTGPRSRRWNLPEALFPSLKE